MLNCDNHNFLLELNSKEMFLNESFFEIQRVTEIAGVTLSFDPKPIEVRLSFSLIF